ncbi:hypothetical protein E1A91_A12G149200v1 [Gossypium mustelinum]|uniref:IST1-like protein n=1 Tax=Gossypium mustelinum TaxID=34275 RepID=A0A5D2WU69_GOSMU|nr:hypothetical protein E1A91_A12G149200v1 [Gossypium mustelinum]
MFNIFFGWRKASKCKKLIKRVQCRLKLLKNKRFTIVKQLREDLAQLIKLGYQQTAFNRAEQLLKDENIMAVYEILDHFCEFVNIQLSYIRRHKDCPNDINEAVSSLIFASARCADLPELPAIRKLFGERYGHRFTTVAVELLPGNLVNREIQEKLSPKSVSDDVKYRLIDEIARDYCLQPEILALEYFPELQHQTSDGSEKEGKNIQVDPLAKTATHLISQCHSYSYPNSDTIGASLTCSPPDDIKAENRNISRICTTTRKRKDDDERIKAPSSSETLPQFCEEVVVYLDDIEELRSSWRKEADCQDQRLFKFKSLSMPTKGVVVDGTDGDDESYTDNVEDEKPSSNANNSRRRSFSLEPSSMKDIDHEIYYENHKHQSHHYRKHQKKTVAERKEATYLLKRSKQPGCTELRGYIQANTLNSEVKTCSLENPCYNCSFDDSEEKVPPVCDKGGILDEKFCHCRCSSNDDTRRIRMKESSSPTRNLRRRSYDNGASVYGVFTLPKLEKEESIGKVKGNVGDSHTRKGTGGPYLRATTMPQERPREIHRYSILRTNSMSIHNPNHVHPKLPEYEDIAAKFMALKKEHLLHKQ